MTISLETLRCCQCGSDQQRPRKRLPRGWKHAFGAYWCEACWGRTYVLRAICLPVASPLDCEWRELSAALHRMWAATTACTNWMMTELYTRDARRNGGDQMPPMARTYLYPEARLRFPQLPPQTVAALEQATTRKYRAKRYAVNWTCSASLPTYRYPSPFPVHNQSWDVEIDSAGAILLSVRIEDRRYRLRLKGGPQFHRQRRAVEQIVSGAAVHGECAVYKRGSATIAKLVAWLPRSPAQGNSGMLCVRTELESLLAAVNARDEQIWTYHGDHLRRWVAEHRKQLDRWADDQKFENRPVPGFTARREASVRKYANRMSSACHEIAAQLAGYAERRRFAVVQYDDRERSYCPRFPYVRLRELIAEKLDARGISFQIASGEIDEKTQKPLAEA